MPHDWPGDDWVRLRHMLDAAKEALGYSAGRHRADLDTDRMYASAVVACIQEIGEAAVRVSGPTRERLAAVPWRDIVTMRNRLVHVYFSINNDLVWEVVRSDLSPLVNVLADALGEGQEP